MWRFSTFVTLLLMTGCTTNRTAEQYSANHKRQAERKQQDEEYQRELAEWAKYESGRRRTWLEATGGEYSGGESPTPLPVKSRSWINTGRR